jgi:transposase
VRPQKAIPEADVQLFKEAMEKAKTKGEFRKAQALYLRGQCKMNAIEIAVATCYTVSRVRAIHGEYFRRGASAITHQKKGGRYRSLVSLKAEKAFIEKHTKEAELGGILVVGELKQAFEKEMNLSISSSAFYKLLERHNWRKIMPRKKHPKQDPEALGAFKKTSQKS